MSSDLLELTLITADSHLFENSSSVCWRSWCQNAIRATSYAKNSDETLMFPNQRPSSLPLCLEILSMNTRYLKQDQRQGTVLNESNLHKKWDWSCAKNSDSSGFGYTGTGYSTLTPLILTECLRGCSHKLSLDLQNTCRIDSQTPLNILAIW